LLVPRRARGRGRRGAVRRQGSTATDRSRTRWEKPPPSGWKDRRCEVASGSCRKFGTADSARARPRWPWRGIRGSGPAARRDDHHARQPSLRL